MSAPEPPTSIGVGFESSPPPQSWSASKDARAIARARAQCASKSSSVGAAPPSRASPLWPAPANAPPPPPGGATPTRAPRGSPR